MPYINAYKLKGSGGTQDYGFLVDQLDIKKNQLEADGMLSPGDYAVLTDMARKLYTNPGLTPAQRSNVQVKISDYQSKSKLQTLKDTNDIQRLNRDVKDTKMTAKSLAVNNPAMFLKANADAEKAKIDRLTNMIDQTENAMGDATKYYDERDQAMLDYQDALQAQNDVETKNPQSNYATYMVTNSYGEVVDIKVGKVGTVSGYIPTNATYGGLQVYGKINLVNDSGKNVFSIGGQNFVEGKDIVTGPDGATSVKKLTLEGTSKGGGITVNAGKVEIATPTLRAQNEVRRGGWAEGQSGVLYQKGEDGNYTKYINQTKEQLGLKDGDLMKLGTSTEQSILPYATKTVDSMADNVPPPMPQAPVTSSVTPPTSTTTSTTTPKGRSNTGGAPTERAPETAQGVSGGVMSKVKGFFGSLFGK